MNNDKYINNITLEYLLNPILYDKIIDKKNISDNELLKDISFYRQRICKLTKDMSKGKFIDNNLKKMFITYSASIIYYFKQLDEKELLQSYYNNLLISDISNSINMPDLSNIVNNMNNMNNTNDISNMNNTNDISNINNINDISNINNLIINKPIINNDLTNFVKRININPDEKILPQKRVFDIKDPKFKTKGIKPAKIKEKSNDNINETFNKQNEDNKQNKQTKNKTNEKI
jgi:hypothetical protein